MCLLVAAWDQHPRYRLVLAGNRDEFHDRLSAPLGWWPDAPDLVAGRDLEAGGTWLGADRSGRAAVVTNFRNFEPPRPGAPSRGSLVTGFLTGREAPAEYAARIAAQACDYAGFSLLLFGPDSSCYLTNQPATEWHTLPPGLYGLSNHRLDTPWPKVQRARTTVAQALAAERPEIRELLAGLLDRTPADDDELPDTGLGRERERLLSAPFIVDPVYGTRCTTLVLAGRDGSLRVDEWRFDRSGRCAGRTAIAWQASRAASAAARHR